MFFFSWVAYELLFSVENFRLHSMKFEQKINVLLMGIVNATCAYSQMLLNCFHCVCVFYTQFSSVAQLCPALCDPMDCSTPGLPVHHRLLESTQTHVHSFGDVIQPPHPMPSPSSPTFNLSQH